MLLSHGFLGVSLGVSSNIIRISFLKTFVPRQNFLTLQKLIPLVHCKKEIWAGEVFENYHFQGFLFPCQLLLNINSMKAKRNIERLA